VRVLVTFAGGRGHLLPILPVARALRAAGHDLALSGHPSAANDCDGLFGQVFPHQLIDPKPPDGTTGTLRAPDLEHEFMVIGRWYAGTLAERNLARTTAVIQNWRPDLVISDEMDFGSIAAAQAVGLPVAVVNCIASGALVRPDHVAEPLARLGIGRVKGDLEISGFPLSLRHPEFPLTAGAALIRPEHQAASTTSSVAAWLAEHDGPTAYLTLGTIFNTESGDLFSRLLAGLDDPKLRLLVTVGSDLHPSVIGPTDRTRVRVEHFVPQDQVLPHVRIMLNHGGSGSVVGALAHGVPMVVAPMGADQELNADRVNALGAGVVLDPVHATGDDVRRAVTRVLEDPRFTAAARRVSGEVAALPPATSVVRRLELLADRRVANDETKLRRPHP